MKINKYRVHYYSWIDMEYHNAEVLAKSEKDAKKAIDEIVKPEFRYTRFGKLKESLTICLIGPWEVKFPMVLSDVQEQ